MLDGGTVNLGVSGGVQVSLAPFQAPCQELSPDAVYVVSTSEGPKIHFNNAAHTLAGLHELERASMPCLVGCAKAIMSDGKILGACGHNPSAAEVVPDFPTWLKGMDKWVVPSSYEVADNDIPILKFDAGLVSFCRTMLPYPDRSGALLRCKDPDPNSNSSQLWDTNDLTKPRPETNTYRDRIPIAVGRNGRILFGPDFPGIVETGAGTVVIAADAGEVARAQLPEGTEIAAARSSESGFLVVVQSTSDRKDVRQLFLSETGELTQRAVYPNPEGIVFVSGSQGKQALLPDGTLIVSIYTQRYEQIRGRVLRFDPGGSVPIVVLEEGRDNGTPFSLDSVGVLVTGG
jgi:hypothetical protein